MSTAIHGQGVETAIAAGRHRDDIVVGGEIVRHRRITRVIHWTVALTFFVSVFSGMPIWSPLFTWMAYLLGGMVAAVDAHVLHALRRGSELGRRQVQPRTEALLLGRDRGGAGAARIGDRDV